MPDVVLGTEATDTNKTNKAPVLTAPTLTSVDHQQISTENRTVVVGCWPSEMVRKVNGGAQVVGLGFEYVMFIQKVF